MLYMYKYITIMNSKYILDKARKKVSAIVLDYDGTIFEAHHPIYTHEKAIDLLFRIIQGNKIPIVITARDASFRKDVLAKIQPRLQINQILYFASGNGSSLEKIFQTHSKILYQHLLIKSQVQRILSAYNNTVQKMKLHRDDFKDSSLNVFLEFLREPDQWMKFVAHDNFQISTSYSGRVFIEYSKVSFVLPRDIHVQNEFVSALSHTLLPDFNLKGDGSFLHVSRKILKKGKDVDGKLLALKTALSDSRLTKDRVAVFGDSPDGNDKDMLRFSPFSFTNKSNHKLQYKLPHILIGNTHPIHRIHSAVLSLIQ